MQKRNIPKKLKQINGTLKGDHKTAVVVPNDVARDLIRDGVAKD